MPKELPGFYFDPIRNRYFPLTKNGRPHPLAPSPAASQPSTSGRGQEEQTNAEGRKRQRKERRKSVELNLLQLMAMRESSSLSRSSSSSSRCRVFCPGGPGSCNSRGSSQQLFERHVLESSMRNIKVWQYSGATERTAESFLEMGQVTVANEDGQSCLPVLFCGQTNGQLSFWEVVRRPAVTSWHYAFPQPFTPSLPSSRPPTAALPPLQPSQPSHTQPLSPHSPLLFSPPTLLRGISCPLSSQITSIRLFPSHLSSASTPCASAASHAAATTDRILVTTLGTGMVEPKLFVITLDVLDVTSEARPRSPPPPPPPPLAAETAAAAERSIEPAEADAAADAGGGDFFEGERELQRRQGQGGGHVGGALFGELLLDALEADEFGALLAAFPCVIASSIRHFTPPACSAIWTSELTAAQDSVALGTARGALLFDLSAQRFRYLARCRSAVLAMQMADNDKIVLCGLRNGRILSVDSRQPVGSSSAAAGDSASPLLCTSWKMPSSISSMNLLRTDPRLLLASSMDGSISLWDRRNTSRPMQTYPGHVNSHTRLPLALDQSESTVASGGEDSMLRFWGLTSGKLLATFGPFASPLTALTWPAEEVWRHQCPYSLRSSHWASRGFSSALWAANYESINFVGLRTRQ